MLCQYFQCDYKILSKKLEHRSISPYDPEDRLEQYIHDDSNLTLKYIGTMGSILYSSSLVPYVVALFG